MFGLCKTSFSGAAQRLCYTQEFALWTVLSLGYSKQAGRVAGDGLRGESVVARISTKSNFNCSICQQGELLTHVCPFSSERRYPCRIVIKLEQAD